MDLKKEKGGDSVSSERSCSICLDPVVDRTGARSVARLCCGHDFHLDCIGSAFNAKGVMQCPNCRKIEKGQWLYANGQNQSGSTPDLDFEFFGDEFYDFALPELPVIHWCPFRGFTQLASIYEEGDPQLPYPYYDMMGTSSMMGGEPSAGSSSSSAQHDCPYLAQHSMHAPSSSSGPPIDSNLIQYRPMQSSGYGGAIGIPEIIGPIPFLNSLDQPSTSQFGLRMHNNNNNNNNRNETHGHQRLGPYVHTVPVYHGSVSRSGGNSSMGPPPRDSRSHSNHSRNTGGTNNGHMYNQSMRTSNNPPIVPVPVPVPVSMRRVRPRGVTFFSPVSNTGATGSSSNADLGGFYGFSGRDGDGLAGRHLDQLPWIPLEGESQWWGPFNPAQSGQTGGLFSQRGSGEHRERDTHRRSDNSGYQNMPPPHHRPPYM